ncbi:hypothetical protein [Streptomyces sp. NPDC058758]|uniref:hypothetical protein n=1 Tax=Streptomyces sp. NPDC058758 TaxID=3346627 RepID=UPI0036B01A04
MSVPTPGDIASATTTRNAHLVRKLTAERQTAIAELAAAKSDLHTARKHSSRAESALGMLVRSDEYLPPSQRRTAGIRDRSASRQKAAEGRMYAEALLAASGTVLRAAEIALWNATADDLASAQSLPTGFQAEPISRPTYPAVLAAFEFKAVDRHRDEDAATGWRVTRPGPWPREFVEQVVYNWAKADGAWILSDYAGVVFIATPDRVIELWPVREAPNEGDVLDAALSAYGLRSHPDDFDGVTFRVMAADPAITDDVSSRPHLLMYAGELANRPVREHTEPWSVHLHDETGEYVEQIYAAPAELGCAEQSAACARAVAAWMARTTS